MASSEKKTYHAIKNHDGGDDDGDNDGNEHRNNNNNNASGSGCDGPIFDLTTTPQSLGGGSGNNDNGTTAATHYESTLWTIYLPYKEHITYVP